MLKASNVCAARTKNRYTMTFVTNENLKYTCDENCVINCNVRTILYTVTSSRNI
jgi:hypothetical protein